MPHTADAQLPDADPDNAVAAIDLGTQTALLVIARTGADGALDVLEDHAFAARLGEGMGPEGELAPESVARTLDVLATFARRTQLHGLTSERVRCVGTAVLRRAADADAFLARARAECGLTIEVVDGSEEARLAWSGAVGERGAQALVDIGGGSTEIVTDAGRTVRSIDVGARWLDDALARIGPGADPRALVADAFDRHDGLAPVPGEIVVAGGTGVNLGSLVAGGVAFDHRVADGRAITASDAAHWAERLSALELEDRLDHPIEPARAQVLPAGLWILAGVLERLAPHVARVTTRGVRHGVAQRLLADLA